jgi:hypothetical protein
MELDLIHILAIDSPEWTIPWAGLGAILLGLGSTLTGIASIITARNKGKDEARNLDDDRPSDGGGSRVSGSSATSTGSGSTGENSNDRRDTGTTGAAGTSGPKRRDWPQGGEG